MEEIRKMQISDIPLCAELLEKAYIQEPYNEKFTSGSALKYIQGKFSFGKESSFVLLLDKK